MKRKSKPTWIVVMDSSAADFYALSDPEARHGLTHVAPRMESGLHRHASDLKSDAPGRAAPSAGSVTRHGMEPQHDYHKLEKHDFVRAVSDFLASAHNEQKFEQLVLVAPARSLGELRNELPEQVKGALWLEVAKDLMKLGEQELFARLAAALEERAGPAAG